MASATDPKPAPLDSELEQEEVKEEKHLEKLEKHEIRLYSHSDIFYWWPVWVAGFLCALWTYLDGGRLVVVPQGTEARRNWQVEITPGHTEPREGLILPRTDLHHENHLDPIPKATSQTVVAMPPPAQPHVHIAHHPYLGTYFCIALLVVFVGTHAPLRGLWQWVAVLIIALVVTTIFLAGWWGPLANWFRLLHIQITMGGYVFLASWLLAIWLVTTFYFDRLTYIVFSAGQFRIRQAIGEGEKAFDVTNLTMELLPNVFLRHRILGLIGAGDLVIRTGGPRPEVFLWPNVLFVRSRRRKIEHLLQSRAVD